MTRDQAKQLLPIITAFAEGKEIQVVYNDGEDTNWETCLDPDWNTYKWKYRIKPEPREFWLVKHKDNNRPYDVYKVKQVFQNPEQWEQIHVKEVDDK